MSWTVECADVIHWAETYNGPKFHAALMDPPYELSFMGRKWDSTGIAFQAETWAALAEHLLPGAFGMAFASARGWHRLAVAIEDAGLRAAAHCHTFRRRGIRGHRSRVSWLG